MLRSCKHALGAEILREGENSDSVHCVHRRITLHNFYSA